MFAQAARKSYRGWPRLPETQMQKSKHLLTVDASGTLPAEAGGSKPAWHRKECWCDERANTTLCPDLQESRGAKGMHRHQHFNPHECTGTPCSVVKAMHRCWYALRSLCTRTHSKKHSSYLCRCTHDAWRCTLVLQSPSLVAGDRPSIDLLAQQSSECCRRVAATAPHFPPCRRCPERPRAGSPGELCWAHALASCQQPSSHT